MVLEYPERFLDELKGLLRLLSAEIDFSFEVVPHIGSYRFCFKPRFSATLVEVSIPIGVLMCHWEELPFTRDPRGMLEIWDRSSLALVSRVYIGSGSSETGFRISYGSDYDSEHLMSFLTRLSALVSDLGSGVKYRRLGKIII